MLEFVIIGGGMSGISAGHHLRDRKILILERGSLLSGATGNNAGFVMAGFGEHYNRTAARWGEERAREIYRIHKKSHRSLQQLAASLATKYELTGSLSIALDNGELRDLQESFSLMRKHNIPVEWLDHPSAGLKTTLGALRNPHDGWLDAVNFWNSLAASLPVRTGCEVLDVTDRDGIQIVHTSEGDIRAANVIFCLNAFAAPLIPELKGRYIPLRGQMLSLRIKGQPPTRDIILTHYGDTYWRFGEERLYFGGLEFLAPEDETGIAEVVSARIKASQLSWIHANFIEESIDWSLPETWCSTMAFTVDGFPFVGKLSRKNQYVLSGLCGLGHSYAMEGARWLKELILHGRDIIPSYCSSDRIMSLPKYTGGDWRMLYEAWNH